MSEQKYDWEKALLEHEKRERRTMSNKIDEIANLSWATVIDSTFYRTRSLPPARPKSKPFYNVEAARREITDADYEHLRSLVPQGEYVVLDADEEWECQ